MGTPTESNATADDASPWTVSRPAGVANQLTIVIIANDGNPTLTWPSGYTQFCVQSRAGGFTIQCAYHFEDGSEGTTFDITSSASEKWAAIVYSISGAEPPATQAPEAEVVDGSTATASPDPPSITPSGGTKDYLFIAAIATDGEEADDDTWGNTSPTNYAPSPPRQKTTGVGGVAGTNTALEAAERQLNTAGPENPGTFNNDQSLTYVGTTIAIYPSTTQFKTLSDTVSFSESMTRQTDKTMSDTVSLSESMTRSISKGVADTVSFSDSLARQTGKALNDVTSFVDTLVRDASKALSDAAGFGDSLAPTFEGGGGPGPPAVQSSSQVVARAVPFLTILLLTVGYWGGVLYYSRKMRPQWQIIGLIVIGVGVTALVLAVAPGLIDIIERNVP